MEVLGTYDPIPKIAVDGEGRKIKDIKLDSIRTKYWLGVGAQPSDPAWRLLSLVSCFRMMLSWSYVWCCAFEEDVLVMACKSWKTRLI